MSYQSTILADSPVVYYRLGESSGTTATDASGNAHNGTYSNATLGTAGLLTGDADTAVTFNGSSSYIDTNTDSPCNPGTGDFTLEAWVKTTSTVFASLVLGKIASSLAGDNYWLGYNYSAGKATFSINNADNSAITLTGSVSINDGNAHHIVAVKDGATLRLYVDGVADGTTAFAGSSTISPADNLFVGKFGNAPYFYADGIIDEVAYYNTALSAGQVGAHYSAGTSSSSPEMACSPASVEPRSSSQVITLTGTGTSWSGSTVFTVSGGGATKVSQNVISGTSATVTINTSTSSGTCTITETVTGSTSTTLTVLTYKKILATYSGVDLMVLEPAAYDSTVATPFIYYHHGAGENRESLLTDSLKATCLAQFLSDGYLLGGISADNDWGSNSARYITAFPYFQTNYKLRGTVIWSQSMGGCSGLINFANRAYDDCRGWLGTYPVCNLADMYARGSYTSYINSAFNIPGGGDYATQTAGKDPALYSGQLFLNRYMRFYASYGDHITYQDSNADVIIASASPYAQECSLVQCTGEHGDNSHFLPSDYSLFVKRALAGPATLGGY